MKRGWFSLEWTEKFAMVCCGIVCLAMVAFMVFFMFTFAR